MKPTICLCAGMLLGGAMAFAEPTDSTTRQPPWISPPADATTRVVVLIRHAEKNTEMPGHDVPLNPRGVDRARSLAHALSRSGLTRVLVTPYRRSLDTAAPLMTALADSARVVDAIMATVDSVRAQPWGSTVLVIGHSNTVPLILASLTGELSWKGLALAYDDLLVLTQFRGGGHRVLRLGYGGPEP